MLMLNLFLVVNSREQRWLLMFIWTLSSSTFHSGMGNVRRLGLSIFAIHKDDSDMVEAKKDQRLAGLSCGYEL